MLGLNRHDFKYGITLLDGRRTYRMRGRLGDLRPCLAQIRSGVMGTPGAEEIGSYNLHDFVDSDGNVDVVHPRSDDHRGAVVN